MCKCASCKLCVHFELLFKVCVNNSGGRCPLQHGQCAHLGIKLNVFLKCVVCKACSFFSSSIVQDLF